MASGKGSYNGAGCWKAVCRNWRPASLLNPRNAEMLTGPQVTEHMSLEVRSLNQDVSLREAGQHMQKWKGTHDEGTGQPHLTVTQDGAIIGVISVSNILRYYSGVV